MSLVHPWRRYALTAVLSWAFVVNENVGAGHVVTAHHGPVSLVGLFLLLHPEAPNISSVVDPKYVICRRDPPKLHMF